MLQVSGIAIFISSVEAKTHVAHYFADANSCDSSPLVRSNLLKVIHDRSKQYYYKQCLSQFGQTRPSTCKTLIWLPLGQHLLYSSRHVTMLSQFWKTWYLLRSFDMMKFCLSTLIFIHLCRLFYGPEWYNSPCKSNKSSNNYFSFSFFGQLSKK